MRTSEQVIQALSTTVRGGAAEQRVRPRLHGGHARQSRVSRCAAHGGHGRHRSEDGSLASRAVANGVVYVGSEDHSLYAYAMSQSPTSASSPEPPTLRPNYSLKPAS